MKKIVLAAAIIALGTTAAVAQTSNTDNASATLNVVVSNVKSISISAGSTVNIGLDNTAKFTAAAGTTGVTGNTVSSTQSEVIHPAQVLHKSFSCSEPLPTDTPYGPVLCRLILTN